MVEFNKHIDTYNRNAPIVIGTWPIDHEEWQLIISPMMGKIDSRIKSINFEVEKDPNELDIKGFAPRVILTILDTDSLAVFLYRLGEHESDMAHDMFNILAPCLLNLDEETEPWLSDAPWIRQCPNCKEEGGKLDSDFELQDRAYYCFVCGWKMSYHDQVWPYLNWSVRDEEENLEYRWARLDIATSILPFIKEDADDE